MKRYSQAVPQNLEYLLGSSEDAGCHVGYNDPKMNTDGEAAALEVSR